MATSETETPQKTIARRINLGFTEQDLHNLDLLVGGARTLDFQEVTYSDVIREAVSIQAVKMSRRFKRAGIKSWWGMPEQENENG